MGPWFTCCARLHDAAVGRCSLCGAGCRTLLCSPCSNTEVPRWSVEGVPGRSAAPYGGRLSELIRQLKYHDESRWAGPLGRLLHRRLHAFISPHCILVPVPLHAQRLAERGYNQAALLARALGRSAGLPVDTRFLERPRTTAGQAALGASARRENVRGAFRARGVPRAPLVLVDDVATTGATLRECILCLRRAGAIVQAVVTVALAGADGPPNDSSLSLRFP